MPIDIYELSNRAENDYSALTGVEKALYHIFDFRIIYEMEGFAHYFTTYRLQYIPTIISFLEQANDLESAQYIKNVLDLVPTEVNIQDEFTVEEFFCNFVYKSEATNKLIDAWGNKYYKLEQSRWQRINAYLKSIGHDVVA